jgi:NADH-quinone oxidoreductase subunit C
MSTVEHTPSPAAELSPEVARIRDQAAAILGSQGTFELVGRLPTVRIAASDVVSVCLKLRQAGFDYLILVTAVDYPSENRFELNYVLSNFSDGRELCIAADIPRETPKIATVSDIWTTADWHEREIFDLFGIHFEGHPDLRRILLDDSWEGYPLRKDYVDRLHDVVKRPY